MLRYLIEWRISAMEKQVGASLEYVRHIAKVSLPALNAFGMSRELLRYRRKASASLIHIARIGAVQQEDCGPCLQIVVNLAKKEKTPVEHIRAAVDRKPDALPDDLAEVYRFAAAVASGDSDQSSARDRIRRRHGEEVLVELAMAIASSRLIPTLKRGLGYAESCRMTGVRV